MDGTDRIVFLINQTTIRGRTRLQQYGFLACQLYRADLEPLGFYSDWEARRYGPYSADLARDRQEAEKAGLVRIERRNMGGRTVDCYSLAPRGGKRLSDLLRDHGDLAGRIYETFTNLNKKSLTELVDGICADYPQYAKSKTKDGSPGDGVRFAPDIERMIEEIDSGNANREVQTPKEHIKYIKRLVGD